MSRFAGALARCRSPRFLIGVALAAFLTAGVGELVARYGLGLGDPPLVEPDARMAYYFKPSQDCRRFGNVVRYNSFGMRSDPFPAAKPPGEFRVLCIGDSVLNGGSLTDHSRLATTLLQQSLREELGRPVSVGNVSAGAWGPVSQLAYVEKFSLFVADVVVVVWSSHDANELPRFDLVGTTDFPTRTPDSALAELVTRYLPRYLPVTGGPPAGVPSDNQIHADVTQCMASAERLITLARSSGAEVVVVQHRESAEMPPGGTLAGHELIRAAAVRHGATVVDTVAAYREAERRGASPFRDQIHLSDEGQRALAGVILPRVIRTVRPANPKAE